MSEPIILVVHLPGQPEHRDELEAKLLDVLEAISSEPDFANVCLSRSDDDPDTLVVFENGRAAASTLSRIT